MRFRKDPASLPELAAAAVDVARRWSGSVQVGVAFDARDRELLSHCRDRGFTPAPRHVAELLALADRLPREAKAELKAIVAALARGDRGVAQRLVAGWVDAPAAERALRLKVAARIDRRLGSALASAWLGPALHDEAPRVVREAARAIGKLAPADAASHVPALLEVGASAELPQLRAIVDALAAVGDEAALGWLRGLDVEDADLARRVARAITLIDRRLARPQTGALRLDRPLGLPLTIVARCRRGLEPVVVEQLAALDGADTVGEVTPEHVRWAWTGTLGALFSIRSALDFGLELPLPPGVDPAARVVAALQQPGLLAAMATWTDGPPRFRLAWAAGGKRRGIVLRIAQQLREQHSPLINDSRDVQWSIEVELAGAGRVVCRPRVDPRFAYRLVDVPAASHPTIAAALAWLARPRAGETIWDPFCGSGTELVECARLQPGLHLRGSDLSPDAIAVAERNLAAASLEAASLVLRPADACVDPPPAAAKVDAIVCNPPMGRRVAHADGLTRLLEAFVAHAASLLPPGGRIVWLSPQPGVTGTAARRAGLTVDERGAVDMGGFVATLQVLIR